MFGISIVLLVAFIVPGFIADALYRVLQGDLPLTDGQRILRALSWSTLGLMAYALAHRFLPWLGTLYGAPVPGAGTAPGDLSAYVTATALDLCFHTALTLGCVIAVGAALTRMARFARMPEFVRPRAWDYFWREVAASRLVSVRLKSGHRVRGYLANASPAANDTNVVLSWPEFYEPRADGWRRDTRPYMYLNGSEIESVEAHFDRDSDARQFASLVRDGHTDLGKTPKWIANDVGPFAQLEPPPAASDPVPSPAPAGAASDGAGPKRLAVPPEGAPGAPQGGPETGTDNPARVTPVAPLPSTGGDGGQAPAAAGAPVGDNGGQEDAAVGPTHDRRAGGQPTPPQLRPSAEESPAPPLAELVAPEPRAEPSAGT